MSAPSPNAPIVPMVLHHGAEGWTVARTLGELIDWNDELRALVERFVPNLEILVDDLARVSEAALRHRPIHPRRLTVRWALRVEYSGDDPAELGARAEVLHQAAELGPRAGFEHALRYLTEGEQGSDLVDALTQQPLSERVREDVISLAKKWHDEGLREGIEKGIEKGVRTGRVEVLLRLLRRRFPSEPLATYEDRVRSADLDTLDRWTDQVLVGDTVEDILR